MNLQAVFLDRDGTIGGTGQFIHPRDFVPYEGALAAVQRLRAAGVKVFAFTNQWQISLGNATEADFQAEFAGYGLNGAYVCPHHPDDRCECRKPRPGMLQRAAAEHGLDLSRCAVVGDVGGTDMLAAHAVGAVKVLVRTGWGEGSLGEHRAGWGHVEPDYVAADLVRRWVGYLAPVGRRWARSPPTQRHAPEGLLRRREIAHQLKSVFSSRISRRCTDCPGLPVRVPGL